MQRKGFRVRLPWVLMEDVSFFTEQQVLSETHVPLEAEPGPVASEHYRGYRKGRVVACADVVSISNHMEDPMVLLSRRTRAPMQGEWWVQGGTMSCYTSIDRFLQWAFLRECDLLPLPADQLNDFQFMRRFVHNPKSIPVACGYDVPCLIGVYRVPLNELPDAIAPVGLGVIKKSLVPKIGHDADHDRIRWATERDIRRDTTLHPYVRHISLRALKIYKEYFV